MKSELGVVDVVRSFTSSSLTFTTTLYMHPTSCYTLMSAMHTDPPLTSVKVPADEPEVFHSDIV